MDIKNILEKLSELDAKKTLMESAPATEVLLESTTAESTNTSIYDILVSELLSEKADPTKPASMKTVNGMNIYTNDPAPAAGIANPAPNLNVAAPTDTATTRRVVPGQDPNVNRLTGKPNEPAPAAAPAADAKPGFADRLKTAFQKRGEEQAQYDKEMAVAGTPEAKAEWAAKLTPSQLKWLGGADPSDPAIRARMPKPQPGETPQGAAPAPTAPAPTAPAAAPTEPVATTSPVATPAVGKTDYSLGSGKLPNAVATATAPATDAAPATAPATDAPPAAPAVTANPTATPAKAPYKGSAGAQEIQKLNPNIKDVNKIQVGQELKMPDGSTYTVKPGDTLDRIAKGVKPAAPADDRAKVPPATKPAPNQLEKAPPAAPAAPAAPTTPKKDLSQTDLDRIKQLSGAPTTSAKPGKLDLSVNNPAMNPVLNAKESMERILSIIGSK